MKRVLIFSLAYYPHVGGAEVAIKEITDRIGDIEFHMLTLRFSKADPKEEKIGNVFVHRLPALFGIGMFGYISKIFFVPQAALAAKKLHKKYKFDGAWAMMTYMVLPLVLLGWLGVKIPYVLNLQDGDPFEYVFSRWFILPVRPMLVSGVRNATVVQPLSHYLADWARGLGFKGGVEVIPNGVDIAHFAQEFSPTEVEAFKRVINKKEGDVTLITTSRLVHKNAIDDVIKALTTLPEHVQFVVYGIGPELEKLKLEARSLKLEARVQFLGYIGHNDMPKYLRVSDIFIRPSRSEGMGASFVEAMAIGLPVIATQEGGIKDFLFDAKRNPDHEPTGFAVNVNSPEQIAEKVKEILDNPEQTKRVVENAKRMVQEKYDWNKIANDMKERVFNKMLAN